MSKAFETTPAAGLPFSSHRTGEEPAAWGDTWLPHLLCARDEAKIPTQVSVTSKLLRSPSLSLNHSQQGEKRKDTQDDKKKKKNHSYTYPARGNVFMYIGEFPSSCFSLPKGTFLLQAADLWCSVIAEQFTDARKYIIHAHIFHPGHWKAASHGCRPGRISTLTREEMGS